MARLPRVWQALPLFTTGFAFYVVLGWYTTIHRHVVVGDAEARLAHAYFVFWNAPAKLTALGFVWPPLMSALFLPFALIKPLATSLFALPLMSGLFGAAVLVTLERVLRSSGMPAPARVALVALFAVNPMFAAYSSDGMSEVAAMWCLLVAVIAFVRWHSDRLPVHLVVTGIFAMLATLIRYENLLWLCVLVPAIALMTDRGGGRRLEVEASAVAVLAPTFYAIGVWTALNWAILGNPFAWLHEETTQAFVATRQDTLDFGLLHICGAAIRENALLFPPLFVVAGALVVLAWRRKDMMAGALAALIVLNVVVTIAISVATHTVQLFELRYNMRTWPLVIVGVAWLYRQSATGRGRAATWALAAVSLTVAIPSSWHMMKTYDNQFDERNFAAALATGRDQSRQIMGIDPVADHAMAEYIGAHVAQTDAVLTDDSQTFGVMLSTGRPALFLDRIDHGDAEWFRVAEHPYKKVRYILISWTELDALNRMYHRAFTGNGMRGLRLAYATRTSKLFAVVGPVH